MRRVIMCSTLFVCTMLSVLGVAQTILVDASATGRVYEGMGALSAGASSRLLPDYPKEQQSQILDYLFLPKYGASLNHFKSEIGGDANSTCGTEPSHQHTRDDANYNRGYEWWLMKEAKKRNPNVMLDVLAWGAPSWINNGFYYGEDMPDYVARFLMGAKRVHGLDIDYVGVWNEMPFDTNHIKNLRKRLDQLGINTKISAADEIRAYNIVNKMLEDTVLYNAVDVVGTHYPMGQGAELYNGKTVYETYGEKYVIIPEKVLTCGKRIWSLEDGPWNGEWKGAVGLAKILTRNYIESKIVKTIVWSLVSSYHDCIGISESGLMKANTPWSGHYELRPALWIMAHMTQFAEPGWTYLEAGANGYLENGGSYVSLASPSCEDVSMLIETVESKNNEKLTVILKGNYSGKPIYVWRSDSVEQFLLQPEQIKARNGKFTINLDKGCVYTLSTTTGQRKGNLAQCIPVQSAFPLPYYDDFDSYAESMTPKFTSDIFGVFETSRTENGNRVLKQVVPQKPIEWMASLNGDPITVIGDLNMRDYTVSVDAMMGLDNNNVVVAGRIPSVRQGNVAPPYGYFMKVYSDGKYELCKSHKLLKGGHINNSRRKDDWHQWRISMPEFFPNQASNSCTISGEQMLEKYADKISIFDGLQKILDSVEDKSTIWLVMHVNGGYRINRLDVLGCGVVAINPAKWNNYKIEFRGQSIVGYVNDKEVCRASDSEFDHGMAAIGTGFSYTIFDNLQIR